MFVVVVLVDLVGHAKRR